MNVKIFKVSSYIYILEDFQLFPSVLILLPTARSPLEAAIGCDTGHVYSIEFIEELLNHRASPHGVTRGLLPYTFYSLGKCRGDIFKLLLKRGADPFAIYGRKTLLHAALEDTDNPKEAELIYLLEHGELKAKPVLSDVSSKR